MAGDGDFEIVDRGGAVHGESGGVTAAHQIDQNGRQSALDDVAAESPEDHFLAGAGVGQCIDDRAKRIGCQDVRKRIQQRRDATARIGLRKMFDPNLAAARVDGNGLQALKLNGS